MEKRRHTSLVPDAARRSYSDVAASRPPSPVVNSEETPLPFPNQNIGKGERQSEYIRIPTATSVVHRTILLRQSPVVQSLVCLNQMRTHKGVQRKCQCRGKKSGTSKERSGHRDMSAAIDSVVEAEKSLTVIQKEMIATTPMA